MTLPGGLRAEDKCPDCGGWHLSAPTHCTKCGKKFCEFVLRRGMCLDCDLADVVEHGLRCEVECDGPDCGLHAAGCVFGGPETNSYWLIAEGCPLFHGEVESVR